MQNPLYPGKVVGDVFPSSDPWPGALNSVGPGIQPSWRGPESEPRYFRTGGVKRRKTGARAHFGTWGFNALLSRAEINSPGQKCIIERKFRRSPDPKTIPPHGVVVARIVAFPFEQLSHWKKKKKKNVNREIFLPKEATPGCSLREMGNAISV